MQADLNSFSDAAEYATRFLAMLAGPLYPILQIVKERLVSLISCTRKVKNVVNKLIKKHQMTFVKASQIMDATLLVSECIDSRLEGGTPVILCKLDGQRVYDHVNWPFLRNTLSQMRFCSRWLKWIEFCIKTSQYDEDCITNKVDQRAESKLGKDSRFPLNKVSPDSGTGGRLILINFVLHFSAYLCDVLIPNPNRSGEKNGTNLGGISYDKEIRKGKKDLGTLVTKVVTFLNYMAWLLANCMFLSWQPRRSRNMSTLIFPTSCYLAFRPDAIFILLRKAYKDSNLGNICRVASWILWKFLEPIKPPEASHSCSEITTSVPDEGSQSDPSTPPFAEYSDLFGDEFKIPEYTWDSIFSNVLDIDLVEEGILHVLYACISQPLLCSKLADNASDFWLALPLVQALLPAVRPSINSSDPIDEDLSLWKQPFVQKALSQIVGTSSSSVYRPLLRACAGYLSSFSPSNGRAACVLIDLCSGVLAPWMPQVIAKIDLALELLEDLLPVIQGAHHSFARARAALKYIVLALSEVMDDILVKYKDAKHQVLFLVEMLEPYLDPAITPAQSIIAFGNVSSVVLENQEKLCYCVKCDSHSCTQACCPSLSGS
ncbi:hypothetical protein MTR67_004365 [Solanum verrucosum]|uniref:Uncharacterized protein n=1 Tax=Solanum verrucosum TaxID=315347 RepID=A0AAF0PXH2_SOLVR|nr:hypothetical protein MTR67_004365 [Solanum verrucosum]